MRLIRVAERANWQLQRLRIVFESGRLTAVGEEPGEQHDRAAKTTSGPTPEIAEKVAGQALARVSL